MTKFRSWNEEFKCFVYFENGRYFLEDNYSLKYLKHFDWQNAEQSTGLKIKDGTEIFTGDTVYDRYDNSLSTVVIREHVFQWEVRELFEDGTLSDIVEHTPIVDMYFDRIDKLGNIHVGANK